MANPVKVIKNLLGAEEDLAAFIQNGPSTGLSGYVRDRFRHRCDEFANLPPWAKSLSGVAGGSIGRFCEPYWTDRGFDGPIAQPPFSGGQCATNYSISGTFTPTCGGTETRWQSPNVVGPIGGIIESGVGWAIVKADGSPAPGGALRFFGSTNTIFDIQRSADGNCNAVSPSVRPRAASNPTIGSVTRLDGQPDNCGDPPPDLQPGPNPPPDPGPLPGPTPTDNPDPDNPIPFLPIPPFDDPVFGPQPITGPDADSPGDGAQQPTQPVGDNSPGEPDAVGNPIGNDVAGDTSEDVDFGEPPMGKIWVGCLVEFSVSSAYGGIPNTGPENTVYPLTVGNVSLRYGSVRGSSVQVRSKWTELVRPSTALEVSGAFIQTRPNTSAKVRPIAVTVCKEPQCTGE